MKKQPKKLTLNRETLRDLTAHNAGGVKGGVKSKGKGCNKTVTCDVTCYICTGIACGSGMMSVCLCGTSLFPC